MSERSESGLARGCYCKEPHPEEREAQGIPPGYCGLCETCGRPGHLRHFPGPVPYTGAWCDWHYQRTALLSPHGSIGQFVWLGLVVLVGWASCG